MAEKLISAKAFTLFVTHYPQITSLALLYPTVRNFHMKTSIDISMDAAEDQSNNRSNSIHFLHRIGGGPCDMKSGYGLLMAELCGFPSAVIEDAREVRRTVQEKFPILIGATLETREKQHQQERQTQQHFVRMTNQLLQHLQLLKNSTLPDPEMCRYLHNLKQRLPPGFCDAVLKQIGDTAENNATTIEETTTSGEKSTSDH